MLVEIRNKDNLFDSEIDEIVTRVKCFIINSNNQVLLAHVNNSGCHLPGGHVENNEPLNVAIKREIHEETGIMLDDSEISEPFFEIKHYTKNYRNSNKNRLSRVLFYSIFTNKPLKMEEVFLTEHEKSVDFHVSYVNYDNFINHVQNLVKETKESVYKIIADETITAFKVLDKTLQK